VRTGTREYGFGATVGQPDAVRPTDPDPLLRGNGGRFAFESRPLSVGLAEPGGDHERGLNTEVARLLENAQYRRPRNARDYGVR
jgi:hypothetical protein